MFIKLQDPKVVDKVKGADIEEQVIYFNFLFCVFFFHVV